MGTVGRAICNCAKKIWNGIKYVGKKIYEGVKYVGKKVYEGVKYVAEKVVRTVIAGVVVMVTVAAALVASAIITGVLGNFSLGLEVGKKIISFGLHLSSKILFGRNKLQKSLYTNNPKKNEEENQSNYYNLSDKNKDKPNFDAPTKKKKIDQTNILLKDVENFIEQKTYELSKCKIYSFKYDKEKDELIVKNKDNDENDENVENVCDDNLMVSHIFFQKDSNNNIHLELANNFNKPDVCKNILDKIENYLKSDYSVSVSEEEGNSYRNVNIKELKDPLTVRLIIKKK